MTINQPNEVKSMTVGQLNLQGDMPLKIGQGLPALGSTLNTSVSCMQLYNQAVSNLDLVAVESLAWSGCSKQGM